MITRQGINTTVGLVLVHQVMMLAGGHVLIGEDIFSVNITVVLLVMVGGAGWAFVHNRLGMLTAIMLGGVALAAATANLASMA